MQILPVIDIKDSRAVVAIAGERTHYRPIPGVEVGTAGVVAVARNFRTFWGLNHLYLADLDAIAGREPHYEMILDLRADGFELWVDAGIRDLGGATSLAEAGANTLVVGLETIEGPATLRSILDAYGNRVEFSLDLKNGQALGDTQTWDSPDPLAIAAQATALGVQRLLLLDLAHVGMNSGVGTILLAQQLRSMFPEMALSVGGGVRGIADLRMLKEAGIQTVLVGSALRENRLKRAELAELL